MSDESGQYVKLRNNGMWLPLGLVTAVVLTAIAWGTNGNRLTTVEDHANRIDTHLTATDQQSAANKEDIGLLKYKLEEIQQLLREINGRLQRAEEERRK